MTEIRARPPALLLVLFAVLPLAALWSPIVVGVQASGADFMIGLFLLGSVLVGLGLKAHDGALSKGVLALVLFAVWVSIGSSWSSAPIYAVAKSLGYAAMALMVGVAARSGVSPARAADAWLLGSGLTLAVFVTGVGLTSLAISDRVLFDGGGITGLPFRRARGPFPHPNAFGDYLVLSLALLAGRWTAERRGWGVLRWWLLAGLAGALVWSASSAILGAGVLLVALGLRFGRRSLAGWSLAIAGVAAATIVSAGALRGRVPGFALELNAVRPGIWASAIETFLAAPVTGVGAAPTVATALDPAAPWIGPIAWDAHSVSLSVLAQYGLIGALLLAVGVFWIVRPVLRVARANEGTNSRVAWGVVVGLVAWAAHGLLIAGEDLRHAWLFLALAATCRPFEPAGRSS